MPATVVANVVAGFSPVNRALIYLNFLLSQTQFFTGFDTKCPSNLGFLAFNLYQQYIWFIATKEKQLHALSLVVSYINLMYTGTISSFGFRAWL
ncbi:hypothetical protein D9611_005475 [Ephemerocybe angulata]|uniref:Uncharacterized protein n=1 Tax=Ephemerocybe angulata TaxID=980116 RepID=A0A8H5BZL8_9AGAR|nr:hypothetical protein D9611_005475 [Tulosesus angulatus]